jgi:riboflavin biosynthesis pyrimidine reductase
MPSACLSWLKGRDLELVRDEAPCNCVGWPLPALAAAQSGKGTPMKPYVICHMNTSIDGRTWGSRWRPAENRMAGLFERIHEQLGNGSWLIGRVTGSEYAKADAYPDHPGEVFPREPWFIRRDAAAYGIALDAHGKIAWGRADIGGDPIVAVLTKQVSDAHLAGLRRDGVSYIFAGERELNLALALDILNRELRIERLLLEGGGKSNGSFLRAGLIDEISLAVCPAVDGARGGPYAFDSREDETDARAPLRSMTLESCEVLEGGAVWLRYRLQNG